MVPPLGEERAEAATPAVSIDLAQSSPDSRINAAITLTATVTFDGQGSADDPGIDWYVEFSGTGDGGWSSGPIKADEGVATYDRASSIPQTETITAGLVTPGCGGVVADPLTHQWWVPTIELTPADSKTSTTAPFEIGALLRHGASAAPDRDLAIRVTGIENGIVRFADTQTTDSAGRATFQVPAAATDSAEFVRVTEAGLGGATELTTHVFVAPHDEDPVLTLTPTSPRSVRTGGEISGSATLDVDGERDTTPDIQFLNRSRQWVSPSSPDEDGQVSFTYASDTPVDGAAVARSEGIGLRAAFSLRFWTPLLVLTAPGSTSVVGQDFPATAVLSLDGVPIGGSRLLLTATSAGQPTITRNATTGADGRATFPGWSRPAGVSDEITIEELGDVADPASTTSDHAWVAAPPGLGVSVDLDQSSDDGRVGSTAEFTATVTANEEPVQGWDVSFDGLGLDTKTATTNAQGRASVTESTDSELSTAITATVAIGGCQSASDAVGHQWWRPTLALAPVNTTSPARRPVNFTATLTRLDSSEETDVAVVGQPIKFTMRSQSCDLPVQVDQDDTDEDGVASVPFTRDGPSIDGVTATEIDVVAPVSDVTGHTWGTPDPPPVSIGLDQSTVASRAGTRVTVTATVRDTDRASGRAAAGVPVSFVGLPAGADDSAVTNSRGEASVTFAGVGTAATSITATTRFGCGLVVSEPITHEWFVPRLRLTPADSTTETGTTATVTAELTNAGSGVGGQVIQLTVDSSIVGESTLTREATTKGDGTATFHWSRGRAGVDALTAREVILVQSQQATATHTWREPPPVTPPPVTPPPVTPPPVTPPPVTPPPVITPSPEPEESASPSPEPHESSTPTPTPTPTPRPTPTDVPSTSTVVEGPEVGRPGGDIQISGTGCGAGETVTVKLGDVTLGTTRAAADGTFYLRTVVPDLPLGRYVISSSCGTTIGDKNVDITAPQVDRARAGIAAAGMTTASTFVFFVLLIKGVISFLPKRFG